MLSDSIFEALENLWEAIRHYEYADSYQERLIDGIVELALVVESLDYGGHPQTPGLTGAQPPFDDMRPIEVRRELMKLKMVERFKEECSARR